MGIGRTGDGAMGFVTVMPGPVTLGPVTPGAMRMSLMAVVLLLAGCNSVAQIAAVVTGGASGAATGSPAVGFAVGVAVDAGATYVLRYYGRSRQGAEQDAIAQVAGELPVGTEAAWKIEHTIPIGDEHGRLQVVRVIDSPLAMCKEIAFSVEDGKGDAMKRAWFTSDICKQAEAWKWASAEPAVERWGFLQ
ncbi:MAG: hypothetical protein QOD93_5021 [Acetobacteraceae bacterium]|nr:hypothetical protein [Acetobacteraceae bacterium]